MAFLTVDIETPPFETLDELADLSYYKLGTVGGTAWVDEMRVRNFRHTRNEKVKVFLKSYIAVLVLKNNLLASDLNP